MRKNKKKNSKVPIMISLVIITILTASIFIVNIIRVQKQLQKNTEIIKYNYDELSINVEEYNQIRSNLSDKLNNFFYDKYGSVHEEYVKILTNYNDNIKKIDKNINNINSRCNIIYKDITINKICDNYEKLYEKIVNLYVSDLTNYNNKITSYNEYKEEDTSLFKLVHTDYIDYNKDEIYEGKEMKSE